MRTLLRDVEVDGVRRDVGFTHRITGRSQSSGPADIVLEGAGGALLPGLHDHHLHLLAMAAAAASIDVSGGLGVLRSAAGTGWLRAVGATSTALTRADIDAVVSHRPVRVQHRSGHAWTLNTAALRALRLPPGDGRITDVELPRELPDLAAVGARLAGWGITEVTDATPDLDPATCRLLRTAVPQRVSLLGDPGGAGAVKILLPEDRLHELPTRIAAARPRPVAVHCVSRAAVIALLAALEEVGRVPGDRVEHASVVPAESVAALPAVVTQPGFVAARGDDYLRDVEPADIGDLYRFASLLAAGVPVVAASDAPYGPADPWTVLRAARDRTTPAGLRLGAGESVPVQVALAGYLRPTPGARPRRVRVGAPADLVLLHAPLAEALRAPSAALVRATWIGGVAQTGAESAVAGSQVAGC